MRPLSAKKFLSAVLYVFGFICGASYIVRLENEGLSRTTSNLVQTEKAQSHDLNSGNQTLVPDKLALIQAGNIDQFMHNKDPADSGHAGEAIIADALAKQIRICCLIVMIRNDRARLSAAINTTWASHCNRHMFISNETDNSLPWIASSGERWNKTAQALVYSTDKLQSDCDFFVRANDATFVIVENLRQLLLPFTPERAFIMGRQLKESVQNNKSSDAGISVISKNGLISIVKGIQARNVACMPYKANEDEDLILGRCAKALNVELLNSRDQMDYERFYADKPTKMLADTGVSFSTAQSFANILYDRFKDGECCSEYAVSFNGLQLWDIYAFEYLFYHLHPYGIHRDFVDVVYMVHWGNFSWPTLPSQQSYPIILNSSTVQI